MVSFTKEADEIFRDYVVDGDAGSGIHNPVKPDIRTWGGELQDALTALPAPADIPVLNGSGYVPDANIDPKYLTGTGGGGTGALSNIDESVDLTPTFTNHGGGQWRAHTTKKGNYIVFFGDTQGIGINPLGDNQGRYLVPWDAENNGTITALYAGVNYLLIVTDAATGNVWHLGNTEHGQGGNGATSGSSIIPTQIQKFVTDAVKIASITTEANLHTTEHFWFAVTTTGNVYSCGYSGSQHVMGYNNTANLSVPRKMTYSDGLTFLEDVSFVKCSTRDAPVFAVTTTNKLIRWGAGTNGAHGNNDTNEMVWPEALETTHGSGIDRTDIIDIEVTGSYDGILTVAASWILVSGGKILCAGSHRYGLGDGISVSNTDQVVYQEAAGIIDTKVISSIHAGGGSNPTCVAVTDDGKAYLAGFNELGLLGSGNVDNKSLFVEMESLPTNFSGNVTDVVVAGGDSNGSYSMIAIEATINSKKYIATCGYDGYYQTATGITGELSADRTYSVVVGAIETIDKWSIMGTAQKYGIEVLNTNGVLFYAGANEQGQGGVQVGDPHASIPYLQPCIAGSRIAKTYNSKGNYDNGETYEVIDTVLYKSSLWECIQATTGNAPPDNPATENDYWRMLVRGFPELSTIVFEFDGGGIPIGVGQEASVYLPFNGTVHSVTLLGDQTGSVTIDLRKGSYDDFPLDSGDSICAAAKPSLTSAVKNKDETLTGWTTTIATGEVLVGVVESVSAVNKVTLNVNVERS